MPHKDTSELVEIAKALVAQLERGEWSDATATAYEISYLASQESEQSPPDRPEGDN